MFFKYFMGMMVFFNEKSALWLIFLNSILRFTIYLYQFAKYNFLLEVEQNYESALLHMKILLYIVKKISPLFHLPPHRYNFYLSPVFCVEVGKNWTGCFPCSRGNCAYFINFFPNLPIL